MNRETPEPDHDEVRRAFRLFIAPGAVTEMRVFKAGRNGTVSGYYDNPEDFARDACTWSGKAPGVYLVPNPVNPSLLARAANRARTHAENATTDADILERRWLLIDFDPIRPTGIGSSDEEHRLALDRAWACRAWLTEQGWPAPIYGDSGNGGHLDYRIELPTDEANRSLLAGFLTRLAEWFSDARVKCDASTFNAARIWRVYGTANCKGDSTTERPHRLARLLEEPDALEVVPVELISALLPTGAPAQASAERRGHAVWGGDLAFDLEEWISDHGLDVTGPRSFEGGRKWVFPVCPWRESHTNKSAYILQRADGAIAAGCRHDSCAGENWDTLKDRFDPGWRERAAARMVGEAQAVIGNGAPAAVLPAAPAPPLLPPVNFLSAKTLRSLELPPPKWAVPDLLPEGLSLLAGKPKQGKSWWALQNAVAIATGGMALGKIRVDRGPVLYVAMEDTWRRLKWRLLTLLDDPEWPENLTLADVRFPRMDAGGFAAVEGWLKTNPEARLLIIDTLARFRAPSNPKANVYDEDYRAMTTIKRLADEYAVAVLVIHHVRKADSEDPFDTVSGSSGLTAAADTLLVLKRIRGQQQASLYLTGRDIEDAELALQWDKYTGWNLLGDAVAVARTQEQEDVLRVFRTLNRPVQPREVAQALNIPAGTARVRCFRMAERGLLVAGNGAYSLPAQSSPPSDPSFQGNAVTPGLDLPFPSTKYGDPS